MLSWQGVADSTLGPIATSVIPGLATKDGNANHRIEDVEHFLLLCTSLGIQLRDLLTGEIALLRLFVHSNPSNEVVMQLLMHNDGTFLMKSIRISLS